MVLTKRFDRILKLYFLLQAKNYTSLNSIKEVLQVSERTIYRDLSALQLAGVPILFEEQRGYYLAYPLHNLPHQFTDEELLSLLIMEQKVKQQELSFIQENFSSLIDKIKSTFKHQLLDTLEEAAEVVQIRENSNTNDINTQVIQTLHLAAKQKKVAELIYQKPQSTLPEPPRNIEVIGLYQQSNYWYLLAFCCQKKDYRNFRIDRIKNVILLNQSFEQHHLPLDIILTRVQSAKESLTKVILEVPKETAHYFKYDREKVGFIAEQYLDNGNIRMVFESTYSIPYFARWFMPYIDIAKIIAPTSLQEEISAIIKDAQAMWNT